MLPQIQGLGRTRRTRARPINPLDNSSTTGLLVNPNGSYVANSTPQTNAYAGQQGQFGANLPSVNVQPTFLQSLVGYNPNRPLQQTTEYSAWNNFINPLQRAFNVAVGLAPISQRNVSGSPDDRQMNTGALQYDQTAGPPAPLTGQSPYWQLAAQGPGRPNLTNPSGYWESEKGVAAPNALGYGTAGINNIMARIAAGETEGLSAQDMQAVENILTGGAPAQPSGTVTNALGTGSEEFMNTGFMQQNLEQGVGFYDQLRWDPQRKKYVKIGKLMREGKLTPKGQWRPRGRRKGRGGGPQAAPETKPRPDWIASYGVVNFNTATG